MPLELRARGRLFGGLVKLLWLGAIFVAGLGVAAKAEQPLPNPMPEAWQEGVGDNPPAIVCGEHAHYAVTRAAGELGLGMRRAVAVPSRDWVMDPEALRATLTQGHKEILQAISKAAREAGSAS